MEGFSDDEFFEARDDISSASGSDGSLDEEAVGKHQRSRRRDWSRPPRQKQQQPSPPQWLTESRFSVWQDGPKSIEERRRLLYERFGIPGRNNEVSNGQEDGMRSAPRDHYDGTQLRVARFGIRKHASPARTGLGRPNSSVDFDSPDFGFLNRNGSLDSKGFTEENSGIADDRSTHENRRLGSLEDEVPLPIGRSQSDSVALLTESKTQQPSKGGSRVPRSGGASPLIVPGIERLTQTSGAVLRDRKWASSSSKSPTEGPVTVAPESAPSNPLNLAVNFEIISNGNSQPVAVEGDELHANASNVQCGESSPRPLTAVKTKFIANEMARGSSTSEKTWTALGEGPFITNSRTAHLPAKSVDGLVDALQSIVGAARLPNQNRSSSSFDKDLNDIACKIKDLDSGKEFIVDELGRDGDPKLRELETGKELTLEEFENSLGLSPVIQEVRRRERERGNLDEDYAAQAQDSTASSKKKKKSLWVRTMKGVAKTVGGVSRTKSIQDSSRLSNEGSQGKSGGEEREGPVLKEIRREGSVDKAKKYQFACVGGASEEQDSLRTWSPQAVKVNVNKKNFRDLSDLNMGQEIQAHEGAIWTMKFSLDGRYLASAGQDRVVHLREVLDHPLSNVQVGVGDAVVADSGGAGRNEDHVAGVATPERSQREQSQEGGSLKRRGSRRGSIGKRKSVKNMSSSKLPKLFWLSEAPLCSFKGHTEDVLDLSWSRSELLLSSSMDKTVRLWHISYGECLRVFTHNDYVTCIEFSPTDDRYFLSGSLDDKVRIWSIPEHQVVDWSDVREMVTAASYSPNGKRAVIGTYKGTCRFYNTSGHKLQLDGQFDVPSAQAKKSRGKKITGLQFMPGDSNRILMTSNDSRVRVYDGQDLILKLKGLRNINSQISASFTRPGNYIVSASEDSRVYIWNSNAHELRGIRKDKPQSYEHFPSSHVTIAVPWPGMEPQPTLGVPKDDQSEVDTTSSSRQSGNDEPFRSPLGGSPSSSSSSTSNGSSQSGLTSESVGECQTEQSTAYLARNGSGFDGADDEVTSRRSDGKPAGTPRGSFRTSSTRDLNNLVNATTSAASPALSVSNNSPRVRQSSFRSPNSSFFPEVAPKSSATWPEEKLPPLKDSLVGSQGGAGSWSAYSPSPDILPTDLSPEGSTAGDATTVATWGLVIVTASLRGEIRTFQNYGYPVAL